MIDNYNRKIDYARISLTERCNLRCIYCAPQGIDIKRYDENQFMSLDEYKKLIKAFSKIGISKIRFTGGEPLQYPNLEEIIEYTSKVCKIPTVSITTNGVGLKYRIKRLKELGLSSVNISLDTLDRERYKKITKEDKFGDVIKGIRECLKLNIKTKLNCVFIEGMNSDELNNFISITKDYNIDVRFIELMPIGEGAKLFDNGYVNLKDRIASVKELGRDKSDEESVATYYKIKGAKGRVGIITPMSCSFCTNCNKIRVISSGNIKLCLYSKEEIDINPYLDNEEKLENYLKYIIKNKPKEHTLNEHDKSNITKKMYQVGG
ncbi:GTP 3',8-cyclase MoaA [Paraclostridium ghonii]|uniref:GTP 3',8-cyclase MoaA n=1 Tax=Paraclostridium ghonii TaxID=29358 RepID=UPI00202CDE88|nr:GTP 3',8-cyclase MoaA [Paeniclostridium ghonii]MCM0164892.1 GTP 3',8-cyclase MoaA [Paeniclostridium ghonii]